MVALTKTTDRNELQRIFSEYVDRCLIRARRSDSQVLHDAMCRFLRAWLQRRAPLALMPACRHARSRSRVWMSAPLSTSNLTIVEVAAFGGAHQRVLVAFDREIHVGAAIDQQRDLIEPARLRRP